MDRRVGGVVVLLCALVAGLVVPRLLHPRHLDGVATAEPPAPPLAVGDCILDQLSGFDFDDTGTLRPVPITVASCELPHQGEIALVKPLMIADFDSDSAAHLLSECRASVTSPWQNTAPVFQDWSSFMSLDVALVGPDQRQRDAGQTWTACAAVTMTDLLSVPLASIPAGIGAPPVFALCSRTQAESDAAVSVSCTEHHDTESIGYRRLDAGSKLTQVELESGCAALTAVSTGRSDLVGRSDLTVETAVYASFVGDSQPVIAPLPADATGGWATCLVRTVGDRELTGSLRRLGDAPLPWAS